jgi:hypothetical protein
MEQNKVWDFVKRPEGCNRVRCKWVFKIKRVSNDNVERYKDILVTKGFTKKDDIDYKEIFDRFLGKTHLELLWL